MFYLCHDKGRKYNRLGGLATPVSSMISGSSTRVAVQWQLLRERTQGGHLKESAEGFFFLPCSTVQKPHLHPSPRHTRLFKHRCHPRRALYSFDSHPAMYLSLTTQSPPLKALFLSLFIHHEPTLLVAGLFSLAIASHAEITRYASIDTQPCQSSGNCRSFIPLSRRGNRSLDEIIWH